MLPYLKNRDEGVGVGPSDPIKREPDEGSPSYDAVDAIIDDFVSGLGIEPAKRPHLRAAFDALIHHIQTEDMENDKEQVSG